MSFEIFISIKIINTFMCLYHDVQLMLLGILAIWLNVSFDNINQLPSYPISSILQQHISL